ncbi:hypothetical protein PPERSA_12514 [Pseudocohnilembus persalinus]|uniref:Leucine rich repeat protein n=1 Tax=Pseudocohnilembus persalinus TaxID=266149 RepID=A0A0V0QNW4_PSEPJ|nr:hypothetical protein PPERSA_12514 [Pseudocohnilembus persalinus]|eukprot:KRX04067.1 hypothetical protein PPERSA_12514 [Pseudocohnilembus persalinus]
MTPQGCLTMCNGIKQCQLLKHLNLDFQVKDITQKGFLTINSSINEMEKLESLELCYKADYNDLKPNILQGLQLPESLQELCLQIYKTNLQDLQVWDIMEGIKRLEKLRYLYFDFSYNQIGKLHDVLQSEGLKGLKYLHHLQQNHE